MSAYYVIVSATCFNNRTEKAAPEHMRFKSLATTTGLSPMSIDQVSLWFVENATSAGFDKREITRVRLLFEEALLNLGAHYSADQDITVHLERQMGRYRLRILVKGDQYNPLRRTTKEQSDYVPSLFVAMGVNVQYSYSMGVNSLRLPLNKPARNPLIKIAVAIAVGVAVGWLGNVVIPVEIQQMVTDTVLNPISDMWIRLLQCISGPIVFCTAIAAAMSTKRISDYGGSRVTTVARYFVFSTLAVLATAVCFEAIFALDINRLAASREVASSLLDDILKIVPDNIIDPLSTANTPQLLLIAIGIGYVLAAMDSQVEGLKSLVQQANVFGLTFARQICAVVPYFVGLLLCLKIWTHDTAVLEKIWIPLGLAAGIALAVLLVVLLVVSARLHVNPFLLARKLKDPFLRTLRKGTLNYDAIDALSDFSEQSLGVDREFSSATLLQGLVLYTPASAIGICVFVLFYAHVQNLDVNLLWMLAALALSVTLAVATPPVTGANLLAFVVAFAYLNISNNAFLDAMIFDLVFSVLCIAVDQTLLQLETLLQAKHIGFLNEEVLRR